MGQPINVSKGQYEQLLALQQAKQPEQAQTPGQEEDSLTGVARDWLTFHTGPVWDLYKKLLGGMIATLAAFILFFFLIVFGVCAWCLIAGATP